MPDIELVFSESRMRAFVREHLCGCVIAKDGNAAFSGSPDGDLFDYLRSQLRQLFIKHSSFANDEFRFKQHRYPDGTEIFLVDQFAGLGHLKMLTLPLRDAPEPAYRLTIGYQSFFVLGDAHIPPSPELKKFYSSTINAAKKRTQRLDVVEGRSMWFESDLLKSAPNTLDTVRAAYRL
ncbi:hypothetical protein [Rhizobium rhizogenes]|uniref:hypothetical protein n=1 Tax=Rhizobium rhizogenes TaxID=359 RepID=UPI002271DD20|nr:hypothetical protein [Rhizobium rhizogenes]